MPQANTMFSFLLYYNVQLFIILRYLKSFRVSYSCSECCFSCFIFIVNTVFTFHMLIVDAADSIHVFSSERPEA